MGSVTSVAWVPESGPGPGPGPGPKGEAEGSGATPLLVATSSWDKTIKVWDCSSGYGECVHTLEGHQREVLAVTYNTEGDHLASGSYDHSVKVWDMTGTGGSGSDRGRGRGRGACVRTFEGHAGGVTSVAWVGTMIASGSKDFSVKLWDSGSVWDGEGLGGEGEGDGDGRHE